MRVKKETIVRTIVLAIALVNQALMISGRSILPISDEQVAELISLVWTILASVWAWWKNNSFTKKALAADEQLHGK